MEVFVNSIFDSIDGEVNGFLGQGQPSTFIRFAGCNLACSYCDTVYAQAKDSGEAMSLSEVVEQVHFPHVTITGGEPFMQRGALTALSRLLVNRGHQVSIETNGTAAPTWSQTPQEVCLVVDCKLPTALLAAHDRYLAYFRGSVLPVLRAKDIVKFVIGDEADLILVEQLLQDGWDIGTEGVYPNRGLPRRAYSPCWDSMPPARLVEWLLANDPHGQLSLQIHKVIWPLAKKEC